GTVMWTRHVNGSVLAKPVIDGLQVIIASGKEIVALTLEAGVLNWKQKLPGLVAGSPVVDENMFYIGTGDEYVYALNKHTGHIQWACQLDIQDRPFRTLIYSGWSTKPALVQRIDGHSEIVIVSTVRHA